MHCLHHRVIVLHRVLIELKCRFVENAPTTITLYQKFSALHLYRHIVMHHLYKLQCNESLMLLLAQFCFDCRSGGALIATLASVADLFLKKLESANI